jgi:two-component sensor histidine kinase
LGLARAANSFCRELSEQSKVEIHFKHADIPHTLPKEVSLCLFRVLQEALQNATKYSGVRDFTAELYGTSESIELTVTDSGKGFEEQEAFTGHGLGLMIAQRICAPRRPFQNHGPSCPHYSRPCSPPLTSIDRRLIEGPSRRATEIEEPG